MDACSFLYLSLLADCCCSAPYSILILIQEVQIDSSNINAFKTKENITHPYKMLQQKTNLKCTKKYGVLKERKRNNN